MCLKILFEYMVKIPKSYYILFKVRARFYQSNILNIRYTFFFYMSNKTYNIYFRCKRFFINTIFFLIFPCVALCKCFTSTEDDILQRSEATWTRSDVQTELPFHSDDVIDNDDGCDDDDIDEKRGLMEVVRL